MTILDISIPDYIENAEEVAIQIRENYDSTEHGFGFGFYDIQIECDDNEMALAIVDEIKNNFDIEFEYSTYEE